MRAARRPNARPGLIAIVIILWLMIAAIALTGTLIVATSQEHPTRFPAPLQIFPVTQQLTGAQCPVGTQGMVGQSSIGSVCYELTNGISIKRVNDIHVERTKTGGYAISISLIPADGRALKHLTRDAAGRTYVLAVRDQVVAAPRVDAPITSGRVLITGYLTQSAAADVVNGLKSGRPLPVPTPTPTWTPPPPVTSPPTGTPSSTPSPTTTAPGSSSTSTTPSSSPSSSSSPSATPTTTATTRSASLPSL